MSVFGSDPYKDAVSLVLNAPDPETALEDYAALIKTYGPNGMIRVDGKPRDEIEWRTEMRITPFDTPAQNLSDALTLAAHEGLSIEHVADLFAEVPASNGRQALCIVEDVIVILSKFQDTVA